MALSSKKELSNGQRVFLEQIALFRSDQLGRTRWENAGPSASRIARENHRRSELPPRAERSAATGRVLDFSDWSTKEGRARSHCLIDWPYMFHWVCADIMFTSAGVNGTV